AAARPSGQTAAQSWRATGLVAAFAPRAWGVELGRSRRGWIELRSGRIDLLLDLAEGAVDVGGEVAPEGGGGNGEHHTDDGPLDHLHPRIVADQALDHAHGRNSLFSSFALRRAAAARSPHPPAGGIPVYAGAPGSSASRVPQALACADRAAQRRT